MAFSNSDGSRVPVKVPKPKKQKKRYTLAASTPDQKDRAAKAPVARQKTIDYKTPDQQDRAYHHARSQTDQRKRELARSMIKPGDRPQSRTQDFEKATAYNKTDAAFEAQHDARVAAYKNGTPAERKALFGNPARDSKNPKVMAKFKADSTRLGKIKGAKIDKFLSNGPNFSKLAHSIGSAKVIAGNNKTGAGIFQVATIRPHGAAGATTLRKAPKFLGRGVEDLVNAPGQAIPSVYNPIAGTVEAAQGRPQRLKKLASDLNKKDPIVNTVAAGVDIAKGDKKAAKRRINAAGKSVAEHPGFAALEVAGVGHALGRGVGGATRLTGHALAKAGEKTGSAAVEAAGKKVHDYATTERPGKKVEGTATEVKQTYSKNLAIKRAQVAKEKRGSRKAENIRQQARNTQTEEQKAELNARANKADPFIASDKEIRRRTTEREAVNEDVRRQHRNKAVHAVHEALGDKGRKGGPLTSLIAQNIISAGEEHVHATGHVFTRTIRSDAENYIAELRREHDHGGLTDHDKAANAQLRSDLRKALDKHSDSDLQEIEAAARRYRDSQVGPQAKLTENGIVTEEQGKRAAEMPFAYRGMGARKRGKSKPMRSVEGGELTTAQMQAERIFQGVQDPAFISGTPKSRSNSAFNVSSARPAGPVATGRSAAFVGKGTQDTSVDRMVEQAARTQGLNDAHDGYSGFVKEFGYRQEGQAVEPRSYQDAVKMRDNLEVHTGRHWQVVRLNPFHGNTEQMLNLLEKSDTDVHDAQSAFTHLFEDALSGVQHTGGGGEYALVPKAAADELKDHLAATRGGDAWKAWAKAQHLFRSSVLATSPSWFAGNVIEGLLRAAIGHAGVRSFITGKKALAEHAELVGGKDTRAAAELRSRTVGGGHLKMQTRSQVKAPIDRFSDSTTIGRASRALIQFMDKPGPRHAAHAWDSYTKWVFDSVNGRIESNIQTAMLGHAIRKSHLMDGELNKLGSTAIRQAAQGLTDTNEQAMFGRAVDRMYGKYGKFSPGQRQAIAYYTPFIAWTANAMNFIYHVLPADHPVLTGLVASAENAQQDWLKDQALDQFIKGALPGFLQGSIPGADGSHWRPGKFTPFGAFGSLPETIGGTFTPQAQPVLAALMRGEDWKGKKLPGNSQNPLKRFAYAGWSLLSSSIPAVAVPLRANAIAGKVKENKGKPVPTASDVLGLRVAPKKNTSSGGAGGFSGGGYGGGFSGGYSGGYR